MFANAVRRSSAEMLLMTLSALGSILYSFSGESEGPCYLNLHKNVLENSNQKICIIERWKYFTMWLRSIREQNGWSLVSILSDWTWWSI